MAPPITSGTNSGIGPADFSQSSEPAIGGVGQNPERESGTMRESTTFTTRSGQTVDMGEFGFTPREPSNAEKAANTEAVKAETSRLAAQLRGPELGRRSVEGMIETRNKMDRTKEILDAPPEGVPNFSRPKTGLGTAAEVAANEFAINSVNMTADQMARNELSQQAQRAGLPEAKANDYAENVVNDAKDIRATNPDLSPREVAVRAISRNGAVFGDPAVDAAQNNPGIGAGKPNRVDPHRPEPRPDDFISPAPTEGARKNNGTIGTKPEKELNLPGGQTGLLDSFSFGIGGVGPIDPEGKTAGFGARITFGGVDTVKNIDPTNPFDPPKEESLIDLPTWDDVASSLGVEQTWSDMKNMASNAWSGVKDIASGAWQSVRQGIGWLGDKIQKNAQEDRPSILESRDAAMGIQSYSAKEAFDGVTGTLGSVGKSIADTASSVGSSIADTASSIGSSIADVASDVGSSISDAASSVGSSISDAASSIGGAISDVASSVANAVGLGSDTDDTGSGSDGSDSGGSSRVICTYFYQKGELARSDWAADLRFTRENLSEQTVRGYHFWAIPTVRVMRSESLAGRMVEPVMRFIAIHRAQELAYRVGQREQGDVMGKTIRCTIEPLCWMIGAVVGEQNWRSLYAGATP